MSDAPDNTLNYAGADMRQGRHGVVTTLGVLSIVFGSLGIAYNLLSAAGTLVMLLFFSNFNLTLGAPALVAGPALTDAEVRNVVQALDDAQPLTDPQRQMLLDVLPTLDLPIVPATKELTTEDVAAAMLTRTDFNDDLVYDFGVPGSITVGAQTVTIETNGPNGISNTVADTTGVIASSTANLNMFGGDNLVPFILQIVIGFISAGLAVLLLVAGIATVRDKLIGRRLHAIWWVVRLGIAIGATAVGVWQSLSMMGGFTFNTGGGGPAPQWFWIGALVSGLLTFLFMAAYPIAVAILLRVRPVRAHFAQLAAERGG
jgi:hypothetical protein